MSAKALEQAFLAGAALTLLQTNGERAMGAQSYLERAAKDYAKLKAAKRVSL
jgi:hypothetical protein